MHDPSLSRSGCKARPKSLGSRCNTRSKSLGCGFGYKAVSWKCDNYIEKKINIKERNWKKLIEKDKTKQKKQSITLFQWIVFCEKGNSKIPSWDHDNLMKSK